MWPLADDACELCLVDGSHFQFRYERSNRPTAENRAEETLRAFVVAKLSAEPLKTDQAMVLYARE